MMSHGTWKRWLVLPARWGQVTDKDLCRYPDRPISLNITTMKSKNISWQLAMWVTNLYCSTHGPKAWPRQAECKMLTAARLIICLLRALIMPERCATKCILLSFLCTGNSNFVCQHVLFHYNLNSPAIPTFLTSSLLDTENIVSRNCPEKLWHLSLEWRIPRWAYPLPKWICSDTA